MRYTHTLVALLLSFTSIVVAQNQSLTFDVASVKASHTTGGEYQIGCYFPSQRLDLVPKGMCIAKNAPLRLVIAAAYDVDSFLHVSEYILGGPDWIASDRFEIEAKAANVAATTDELHAMLRNLLAERFKLQVHEQKKDESGFAVVVGKNGPNLTPTTGDKPVNVYATGQPPRELGGMNAPMTALASYLSRRFNLPIVDRTGLIGKYDFKVPLLTDEPPHTLNESDIPAVAKGLEQVGLRLQSEKLPVVRIVIDHAEKPDAN